MKSEFAILVAPEQSRSVGLAVSRLNNNLLLVESSAKDLSSELTTIASLANNISEKVIFFFKVVFFLFLKHFLFSGVHSR